MNRHKRFVAPAALLVMLLGAGLALANGGSPSVDWWVIAGGGGSSSDGGDVALNDTLGQPVIGASSDGGDVALRVGYWANCVAAPAVAPDVSVTRDGVNVVLTWTADPANAQYQVWVSTDPYFDPDDSGGVAPVVMAGTSYTDTGAAASLENHFYVVRGLNACAAASTNSNRTGEFTFGLTPGGS